MWGYKRAHKVLLYKLPLPIFKVHLICWYFYSHFTDKEIKITELVNWSRLCNWKESESELKTFGAYWDNIFTFLELKLLMDTPFICAVILQYPQGIGSRIPINPVYKMVWYLHNLYTSSYMI
jgi:hypothetical protein